jgi:hypothetical protein
MADGAQSYVIDTCAIGDLTGENRDTAIPYRPFERERIWQGLEALIESRRLATVHQVKVEMRIYCPQGYKRLEHYGRRFFVPRIASVWDATRQVLAAAAEQRTLRRYAVTKANRDPADPYLVGLAIVRDAKIVTSEKGRNERTAQQNEQRIPDLCLAYFGNAKRVIHLEDLVRDEGLLC